MLRGNPMRNRSSSLGSGPLLMNSSRICYESDLLPICCPSAAEEGKTTPMKSKPRDIHVKVSAIMLLTNLTIYE